MTDTFYAYECTNVCRSKEEGSRTGVVLDVRTPWYGQPPETILCPVCQTPMTFQTCWKAEPSGHGSRGDNSETGRTMRAVLEEPIPELDALGLPDEAKRILRAIKAELTADYLDGLKHILATTAPGLADDAEWTITLADALTSLTVRARCARALSEHPAMGESARCFRVAADEVENVIAMLRHLK